MSVPPVENPTCLAFKEYEEVPEMVPLDFTMDNVTWVASKHSGAAGALRAEAIELQNCLLLFGCATEELRVVLARMADWMANSSPSWAAYRALITCCLLVLDRRPGVRPVGIGETLRRAPAKLVMKAAGDQANTSCGNLQLCAGLESGIEEATHDVRQKRLERFRKSRQDEEEAGDSEKQEERRGVAELLNNLTIEKAGMKEEAAEHLEAKLGMEVEETGERDGEEEGDGNQRALGALDSSLDAEPNGTMIVDSCNGFNELIRLAMLWTVRNCWPAGARFAFN